MYGEFDLTRPATLDEAISAVAASDLRAVPLAGGTNVLVDLRSQRLDPDRIVDLGGLEGLRGIAVVDGRVTVGARTTVSDLLGSDTICATSPALVEAARVFAGQMVRNAATVAGNIACGSPAADLVAPLLSLDAEVKLRGPTGSRTLALADYYTGYKTDRRLPGELITDVSWPVAEKGRFGSFYKLARRKGDAITVVGVAISLGLGNGRFEGVRIALASVAPAPMRAYAAERLLEGQQPAPDRVAAAAAAAADECSPIDDVRASAAYRRHMVGVLVARMVNRAVQAAN